MSKINGYIKKAEIFIGSVMLSAIIICVFVAALMRLVKMPIPWSNDISQLLFAWVSMIGADLALKKHSHMGVDMLVRKFPKKLQRGLELFSYLLCCGFVLITMYYGFLMCGLNAQRMYATLGISYSFATAAIPVMSVFILLTFIQQIYENIKGIEFHDDETAALPEYKSPNAETVNDVL